MQFLQFGLQGFKVAYDVLQSGVRTQWLKLHQISTDVIQTRVSKPPSDEIESVWVPSKQCIQSRKHLEDKALSPVVGGYTAVVVYISWQKHMDALDQVKRFFQTLPTRVLQKPHRQPKSFSFIIIIVPLAKPSVNEFHKHHNYLTCLHDYF